jgi:hypothetical protein
MFQQLVPGWPSQGTCDLPDSSGRSPKGIPSG